MKRCCFIMCLAGLCGAIAGHAQETHHLTIPFPFLVDQQLVQAGEYEISVDRFRSFISLRQEAKPEWGVTMPAMRTNSNVPSPLIRFDGSASTYSLQRIQVDDLQVSFVPRHEHVKKGPK